MRPSTTSAPSPRTRWMLLALVSGLAVLAFTAACSPRLFDARSGDEPQTAVVGERAVA